MPRAMALEVRAGVCTRSIPTAIIHVADDSISLPLSDWKIGLPAQRNSAEKSLLATLCILGADCTLLGSLIIYSYNLLNLFKN